jgi:hypothetical protein
VTVYRGCGASRVRSLSWTTEKSTAEEFARGHRLILVIRPVLAEAFIAKEAIFAVFAEEYEVLLNPRRLRRLSRTAFKGGTVFDAFAKEARKV